MDLGDISRLEEHVEETHPENNDNAIDYLKGRSPARKIVSVASSGVFGKAKQRLFDIDNLAMSAMASVSGAADAGKLLQHIGSEQSVSTRRRHSTGQDKGTASCSKPVKHRNACRSICQPYEVLPPLS